MNDAIRVLIDDMDISTDEMVQYLGDGWKDKINAAFQSQVIPEMKAYLIDILDDASVNLPKEIPSPSSIPGNIPEPKIDKLNKLKNEIRNNTKQV